MNEPEIDTPPAPPPSPWGHCVICGTTFRKLEPGHKLCPSCFRWQRITDNRPPEPTP